MKRLGLLVIAVTLGFAIESQATCFESFDGPVESLCQGRMIPSSKTRNFHRRSQVLLCSSEADHYIRAQQAYNFEEWNNLLRQDQDQKAQDIRKKQPDIRWDGTIPYQTVEAWTWESCSYVTDGSKCGYDTKTRSVTRYRDICDGEGAERSCHQESYEEEETYQEPRSCWADIEQSETWVCSNEKMTFNANFERPNYSAWKPGAPGYIDAIPNKYDLLPGEVEDVQIFTNGGLRQIINPEVNIGDAWNKYQFRITGSAVGAACRQNDNLHVNVTVVTNERNAGKKSPNAFKLPRDMNGKPLDPIIWEAKTDEAGKFLEKGIPARLRLADSSSGVISTIAAQSKKAADRQVIKVSQGKGTTSDKMQPEDQLKSGFFKNTSVRVRLVKQNKFLWDTTATKRILLDQGEGIVPTTNILSTNQEIAYSDMWEIKLKSEDSAGAYASTIRKKERALRPGQKYYFEVSMYQKGAKGLYRQDCNEDPSFWSCKFRWMGLGRTERNIYSDPIDIGFETDPSMKDERGSFYKFMDWLK